MKNLVMSFSRKKLENKKKYDLFRSCFPTAIAVMRSNTAAAVVISNNRNNIPPIDFDGYIDDLSHSIGL